MPFHPLKSELLFDGLAIEMRFRSGLSSPTLILAAHDAHDDRCYTGIGRPRHEECLSARIEPDAFADQALHSASHFD